MDDADHDHGDGHHGHGHDAGGHDHGGDGDADERTTAPMSEFGAREAGIGALIALVGIVVAFVLPLVAA